MCFCLSYIRVSLEVQPEAFMLAEIPSKAKGILGGDAPLAVDEFVEADIGNTGRLSDCFLCQAHWLKEFFKQYRARWVDGEVFILVHVITFYLVMVIGDFYFAGVAFLPAEADTPLIVYADTVLALPTSREALQTVARRNAEFFQLLRFVYDAELVQCATLNLGV